MKKSLLTLVFVGSCCITIAQNQNKAIVGFKNGQKITRNYTDVIPTKNHKEIQQVKPLLHTAKVSNIQLVTATKFTSSMNAFGFLISESKPLQYNPGVNAVTFIHRKSPTYVASSNSNSGTIVGMISTNNGTSWDSTCIWANATNLARYPQGGIYNPLGNTNKNSAYIIGTGPITGGSGWLGNWYASKSLSGVGNTTPGADQQAHLSAIPTIKKHDMSRYAFTSIDGGTVRSMATIVNDINATTFPAYGMRGAAMVKGTFNAGAFVWSVDSFMPCVMQRADGSKYLNDIPLQAWSENGTIGYIALLGVRCGVGPCQKSYQPIVYKTTNSGASWSLLPAGLFNNWPLIRRLVGINTNSNSIVPYFSTKEGWDATVDVNGDLHLASTIVGAYSSHNDSLDYTYAYGLEQYSYKSANFGWPYIYDYKTKAIGGWEVMIVDSMYTEGPSGTLGEPGYSSNPWTDGAGAKLDYNARIQMSRTVDGKKILYSWSESDTSLLGLKWNVYPDIMMRGCDMSIIKVTPTYNITGGVGPVDAISYFHYMSNKAIGSSSACVDVPFTCVTSTSGSDGSQPASLYYLKGAQFCPTSFNLTSIYVGGSAVGCSTSVQESSFQNAALLAYPNPSNGNLNLSFESSDQKPVEIKLVDVTGKVVKISRIYPQSGLNLINLDLSNYSAGIYLLSLSSESIFMAKKIIKE